MHCIDTQDASSWLTVELGFRVKRNDDVAPALNRYLRLPSSAAEACILSATPGARRLIRKFLLPGAAALALGCAAWPSSGYAQYIDAMHDAEGRCQKGAAAACGEAKNLFATYCAHLADPSACTGSKYDPSVTRANSPLTKSGLV